MPPLIIGDGNRTVAAIRQRMRIRSREIMPSRVSDRLSSHLNPSGGDPRNAAQAA